MHPGAMNLNGSSKRGVDMFSRVDIFIENMPLHPKKKKQLNLAFLSGRLTSSSDLASYALSRSSSVQRSFFHGDVIATTSWAPDVVNFVFYLFSITISFEHNCTPCGKKTVTAWSP